jgi:hypothetical protein
MRHIYVAIQTYYVENGTLPDQLEDLEGMYLPRGKLPEALDGEWLWDKERGTLSHSAYRDLEMMVQ